MNQKYIKRKGARTTIVQASSACMSGGRRAIVFFLEELSDRNNENFITCVYCCGCRCCTNVTGKRYICCLCWCKQISFANFVHWHVLLDLYELLYTKLDFLKITFANKNLYCIVHQSLFCLLFLILPSLSLHVCYSFLLFNLFQFFNDIIKFGAWFAFTACSTSFTEYKKTRKRKYSS